MTLDPSKSTQRSAPLRLRSFASCSNRKASTPMWPAMLRAVFLELPEVSVLVPADDADRARALIAEHQATRSDTEEED